MKKFLKPKKSSHLKQGTKMHPITCEVFKQITRELYNYSSMSHFNTIISYIYMI